MPVQCRVDVEHVLVADGTTAAGADRRRHGVSARLCRMPSAARVFCTVTQQVYSLFTTHHVRMQESIVSDRIQANRTLTQEFLWGIILKQPKRSFGYYRYHVILFLVIWLRIFRITRNQVYIFVTVFPLAAYLIYSFICSHVWLSAVAGCSLPLRYTA